MGEFEELAAAYEGLEESFADRGTLESYRASMLARSGPQADFLVDRLAGGARAGSRDRQREAARRARSARRGR